MTLESISADNEENSEAERETNSFFPGVKAPTWQNAIVLHYKNKHKDTVFTSSNN